MSKVARRKSRGKSRRVPDWLLEFNQHSSSGIGRKDHASGDLRGRVPPSDSGSFKSSMSFLGQFNKVLQSLSPPPLTLLEEYDGPEYPFAKYLAFRPGRMFSLLYFLPDSHSLLPLHQF